MTGKAIRLTLVPVTAEMKAAMHRSRGEFASLVGVSLPEGWPQFPEAFATGGPAPLPPWSGFLFVDRPASALIGNGGLVAPPDERGAVEIGYEIAPQYRNKGYATEAAQALVALALENGASTVEAHTLAEVNASNAVLKKLGMRFVEELPNDEVGAVWRWRMERTG